MCSVWAIRVVFNLGGFKRLFYVLFDCDMRILPTFWLVAYLGLGVFVFGY